VSRALGVVAKLVFFVLVVGVGLVLFSRDARRGVSERWAMHKCPGFVEADVRLLISWAEPTVDHCEGTPGRATCSLTTNVRGGGRKAGPLKDWDCTKRHIPDDFYVDIMRAMRPKMDEKSGETVRANGQEMVDRATKVKEDFLAQIKYVSEKLRDRQELLGEQGDPGMPFPGALGFPIR